MMKITINGSLSLLILFTLTCFSARGMEQIEKNLQDILKQDLTITVKLPVKKYYYIHHTIELRTKKDNVMIGKATYASYPNTKDTIKLDIITLGEQFRAQGAGEQFFYLTMYMLAQHYPTTKNVVWDTKPFGQSEGTSEIEAYDRLFKFYRRVGATVNTDDERGSLDLIKAGYFDEDIMQQKHMFNVEYEQEKPLSLPSIPKYIVHYTFIVLLLLSYFYTSGR